MLNFFKKSFIFSVLLGMFFVAFHCVFIHAQPVTSEDYYDITKTSAYRNYGAPIYSETPDWESESSEIRYLKYVFKGRTIERNKTVTLLSAIHSNGFDTSFNITVEKMSSSQVIRQFGVDVETKISALVLCGGGGALWGSATTNGEIRSFDYSIDSSFPTQRYDAYVIANLVEYYYFVVSETRKVVRKDKSDKIIGYSNRQFSVDNDQTGKFNFYDYSTLNFSVVIK